MKKLIFFLFPLLLAGCMTAEEEASIGIIGGADGPTAVFVASTIMSPAMIAASILTIAMIIGAVIAVILIHKRK